MLLVLSGILDGVDFSRSTGDLVYEDDEGNTLPYRLFLPENYDENDEYPLVLTTTQSEAITAREYYKRMAMANRKGQDTAAIKAARAKGRKLGI